MEGGWGAGVAAPPFWIVSLRTAFLALLALAAAFSWRCSKYPASFLGLFSINVSSSQSKLTMESPSILPASWTEEHCVVSVSRPLSKGKIQEMKRRLSSTHTYRPSPFEILTATNQMRDLRGDVVCKCPSICLDPLPNLLVTTLGSKIPRRSNGKALQWVLHDLCSSLDRMMT